VCLSNTLRLEKYIVDADREGDSDLADLYRKAQAESKKGAERGNEVAARRLRAVSAAVGRSVDPVRSRGGGWPA
jgi:hypothetical protein